MVKDIYYINSNGIRIDLDGSSNYVFGIDTDVIDYSWDYVVSELKNTITSFTSGLKEKKITLYVKGDTLEQYHTAITELEKAFEQDLVNNTYGKLFIGDWYLNCYVIAGESLANDDARKMTVRTYKIVSEDGQWIRATRYFNYNGASSYKRGIDFTIERRFATIDSLNITNETIRECDFKLSLFCDGVTEPITSPLVLNWYKGFNKNELIATTGLTQFIVSATDRVEIDSSKKTITLYTKNGTQNWFKYRDTDVNDIFGKIPTGKTMLYIPTMSTEHSKALARAEMIVYEKKSSPEWW